MIRKKTKELNEKQILFNQKCYEETLETLSEMDRIILGKSTDLPPKEILLKARSLLIDYAIYQIGAFCEKERTTEDLNINLEQIKELTKKDKKSPIERALKLSEECGEVAEAMLSVNKAAGSIYKEKKIDDVIEECIDTTMIALSIIFEISNYKITEEEIQRILDEKIKKWKAKM